MNDSYVLVNEVKVKVDLTKYTERHQFNFDEALDENVSNDQVRRQLHAAARAFAEAEEQASAFTDAGHAAGSHHWLNVGTAAAWQPCCCGSCDARQWLVSHWGMLRVVPQCCILMQLCCHQHFLHLRIAVFVLSSTLKAAQ
jgi:hypothetical protein